MYIQRVPHPLAHFSRDPYLKAAPDVFQTISTNSTTSSVSHFDSHRTSYVVLGVVLTILFLCLVGFFFARRRVASLLPYAVKRIGRNDRREFAPQMQQDGHQPFADGFNIIPSWDARKGSGSSRTPTSPSSEAPSTPIDCEERGNFGVNKEHTTKGECSFVPIPIIVHTPTQTHQTTFLTGPDAPDLPEFSAPMAHHEQFFDRTINDSVIRPHGLPLAPVPEEPTTMASFPSRYFEVDEEILYGMTPGEHPCR